LNAQNKLRLLRGKDYVINDHIKICQPTLDDVFEHGEQEYYSLVRSLTSVPADMKSALFDMGLDYEEVSDIEMFFLLSRTLSAKQTSILFGEKLDLSVLQIVFNQETEEYMLVEIEGEQLKENGCVIDSHVLSLLTDYLRDMHEFKKNTERAGNEYTKQVLIDDERLNIKLNKDKEFESVLYPLVLSACNDAGFKYDFHNVWDLQISVFMKSIQVISRYKNSEYLQKLMSSGFVDTSKLKIKNEDLSWIYHESKKEHQGLFSLNEKAQKSS